METTARGTTSPQPNCFFCLIPLAGGELLLTESVGRGKGASGRQLRVAAWALGQASVNRWVHTPSQSPSIIVAPWQVILHDPYATSRIQLWVMKGGPAQLRQKTDYLGCSCHSNPQTLNAVEHTLTLGWSVRRQRGAPRTGPARTLLERPI